mmetsp:Transcript_26665/g.71965  ORF Transcript_26665/g.71965 Transcript_26665/m.71965 type:complete len:210 (+) Transcript_26665:91-720(+)
MCASPGHARRAAAAEEAGRAGPAPDMARQHKGCRPGGACLPSRKARAGRARCVGRGLGLPRRRQEGLGMAWCRAIAPSRRQGLAPSTHLPHHGGGFPRRPGDEWLKAHPGARLHAHALGAMVDQGGGTSQPPSRPRPGRTRVELDSRAHHLKRARGHPRRAGAQARHPVRLAGQVAQAPRAGLCKERRLPLRVHGRRSNSQRRCPRRAR